MDPFSIPHGKIIYNRTTGSTQLESTTATTANVTSGPETFDPSLCPHHGAAVGAGLGVPLGLLLLLVSAILFWQISKRRALEKHIKRMGAGEKSDTVEADTNYSRGHDINYSHGHELETQNIIELEGEYKR